MLRNRLYMALLSVATALLLILLAVTTASAEVMRGLRYRLALHGYKKAAPEQRARAVERYLYRMLHILGVDASLGWNTAALDEKSPRASLMWSRASTPACAG